MPLSSIPTNALNLRAVGTINLGGAEISAYDPASKRMFTTMNAESANATADPTDVACLKIVDISNPAAPSLVATIDPATLGLAGFTVGDVSSVAVKNGIVALSLIANPKTDAGRVVFLDTNGALLGSATVGSQPDMVTFTPDGTKLLVANEGEPGTVDPAATISIINISGGVAAPVVTSAGFTQFDAPAATTALLAAGLRLFDGKTISADVEPEYIAVTADGTTAVITLQEANAIAFLDIATATITKIVPLGLKDWSKGDNVLDASDKNGIAISHEPVFGQYMPDAVATFTTSGKNYFVTANEGDDRGENVRVSTLTLDPTVFPDAATLKGSTELGRLNVSSGKGINGDTDGDGDVDKLLAYGARSFSIWNADGKIVFDSAGIMEQILSKQTPGWFNTNNGKASDVDTRSDEKGPEPEGVTIGAIGGKTYAFVGLERAGGGVMVFDITDPAAVNFVQYIRNPGDTSPEGLVFIPAATSPTGQAMLAVSNEISNTLTLYSIAEAYNPNGTLNGTEAGDTKLDAGFGDDKIFGLGGDDTIFGGEGNDAIDGGLGTDTLTFEQSGTGVTLDMTKGTTVREKATMLDGEAGWETRALITNGESLMSTSGALNHTSAGTYTPVGIFDGVGAYKLDDDTVRVFVNSELGETAGSKYQVTDGGIGFVELTGARISYFDIDTTTLSIVDGGIAYNKIYDHQGNLVTSASQLVTPAGFSRFCSASLFEAGEFGAGKGIVDRIFFAGEESGSGFGHPTGGMEWALDVATGNLWAVPAFGRGSWENVVQVDTGTTTHVAFLVSDDTTGAPMYLYVGQKNPTGNFLERNGLSGGDMYVWKANLAGVNSPGEFQSGGKAGTWLPIEVFDAGMAGQPGYDALGFKKDATLQAEADALGAFSFSRPEDVARNPYSGNEVVFASTGASISAAATVDGAADATDTAGMVYKISLDFSDLSAPTAVFTVLYNSNADATKAIRNPDNLDWADDGYIYIQEDRSLTTLFTDPAAANQNEASIVRINAVTGEMTRVAEIDRTAVPMGLTDSVAGTASYKGNWESSGILDVSSLFDKAPGTLFISTVQAHSVKDGVIASQGLAESGQLLLLGKDGTLDPVLETDTFKSIENATGSAMADVITGDKGNNILLGLGGADTLNGGDGKDMLDGGAGGDKMSGGKGDDIYVVDDANDLILEARGAGKDLVNANVDVLALAAEIENLTLLGTGDIDGTGNALANVITGNSGANVLNGGLGNDILDGSDGIDTASYADATKGVRVTLDAKGMQTSGAAGSDKLLNIEIVEGSIFADTLAGDANANTFRGGAGDDILDGKGGNDILEGGTGKDSFVLSTALDGTLNIDAIEDFSVADDTIVLSRTIFKEAGKAGILADAAFFIGTSAADASDRLVYDGTSGALFYDKDGLGGTDQVKIAQLDAGLLLTKSDFLIR